jgi:mono/diheme cytochrome c family protein
MQDQPRYEAYESSGFFRDGLSSRPIVEGTVPRGYLKADTQLYMGKMSKAQAGGASSQAGNANATNQSAFAQGSVTNAQSSNVNSNMQGATANANTAAQAPAGEMDDADTFPFPVTAEVINRGQERYRIFCVMCHGETGEGDGMIVRRGFRKPSSYHEERLRQARVGYFFRVMSEGFGAMPPYKAQIPVQDRWAIVAYIRALQLSQMNRQPVAATPLAAPTGQPEAGGHR